MLFPELTQQLRKSFASTWRSKRGRPGTWCWDQLLPALLQVSAGKPGDFKVELEVFPWRIHLIFFHLEYGIPMLSQGSISEKMGSNGWKIFKSAFLETWGCWHVTIILHGGFPSHGGTPRGGWFISWKSAHRKMELSPILGKLHMTNHQISKVRWPEPAALGSLLLPLWPWLKQLNRWANGGWTVEHGWIIGNMFFSLKILMLFGFFSPNISSMVQWELWPVLWVIPRVFGHVLGHPPAILEGKKSASQNPKVHPVTAAEVKPKTCCPVFPPTPCCDLARLVERSRMVHPEVRTFWDCEMNITWGVPWGS